MLQFTVDGQQVEVPDDGSSLLEVLRDRLGLRSAKDGCSPQGQCGCCTVWIDGHPRVACVTPCRRVAGRSVTTIDGLDHERRDRWARAFTDAGASQCGFCTPGIVMRLAASEMKAEAAGGAPPDEAALSMALAAHLCRCTGWRSIFDAAASAMGAGAAGQRAPRDLEAAARRAALEGGTPQQVGEAVALGRGGFADDEAPLDALVAVPDAIGGWAVADTLHEARAAAGKVQGRRSTVALRHPLELPPGSFELTLRTTFVEPAYLEPDASWCVPGGEPAGPLANGGAFGGKQTSVVGVTARRLADHHGRPVRVVMAREDVVRLGPKRPPIAAGVRGDGTGVLRVARTPRSGDLGAWRRAVAAAAPGFTVEEVEVAGPPVSADIRTAGWAEATVLLAALEARSSGRVGPGSEVTVMSAEGGRAAASVAGDGSVSVSVAGGEVLDEVVLRSYVLGAVHQALGWVRREALSVDEEGQVLDLTIRSFGVISARDMPPVEVEVDHAGGPPVRVGDAVFAAVATAAWLASGLGPAWPVERGGPR
ncbi:MAG TPA: 2Fe-2S iron-sulfur cluster-binding protein [Acidimicrobiales bacterium]|nr:2Fe-2S iron-sulfur cluster-binding protein [Acidimicrobiales bacterium]